MKRSSIISLYVYERAVKGVGWLVESLPQCYGQKRRWSNGVNMGREKFSYVNKKTPLRLTILHISSTVKIICSHPV